MTDQTKPGARLVRDLGLYTLARIALVGLIAAVIIGSGQVFSTDIPPLVALAFALVISLPLSMVMFKRLRARVNEAIADVDEQRRRDKAALRARLRGDGDPTGSE